MKAPATLDEFYRTFPTERRCWEALRRMRWPDGFRCPRCEGRKAHRLRARGLWQCAVCRYQASLTAGTPFHGTRVPLRTWFLAMFFVARHKQGISALQLQRDTGLGSYKTAWTLLHKVRATLGRNPLFPLTGDVEADEAYIGGYRPGRNGRGVGKTGVAIAVERREKTAGAVRLAVIPHATTAVLTSFVQRSIRPEEATVFTDAWCSYTALGKLGIDHRPRKGGHGRQALAVLPWAHTVFGNLKTWLRGTFHGVSPKHLQRYLDEFSYRLNRRWREGELFGFVLRRVAGGQPLPYRRLVAEGTA
jgi:transposase-like protein/ribosomal protein L37AE/L43A